MANFNKNFFIIPAIILIVLSALDWYATQMFFAQIASDYNLPLLNSASGYAAIAVVIIILLLTVLAIGRIMFIG